MVAPFKILTTENFYRNAQYLIYVSENLLKIKIITKEELVFLVSHFDESCRKEMLKEKLAVLDKMSEILWFLLPKNFMNMPKLLFFVNLFFFLQYGFLEKYDQNFKIFLRKVNKKMKKRLFTKFCKQLSRQPRLA